MPSSDQYVDIQVVKDFPAQQHTYLHAISVLFSVLPFLHIEDSTQSSLETIFKDSFGSLSILVVFTLIKLLKIEKLLKSLLVLTGQMQKCVYI